MGNCASGPDKDPPQARTSQKVVVPPQAPQVSKQASSLKSDSLSPAQSVAEPRPLPVKVFKGDKASGVRVLTRAYRCSRICTALRVCHEVSSDGMQRPSVIVAGGSTWFDPDRLRAGQVLGCTV